MSSVWESSISELETDTDDELEGARQELEDTDFTGPSNFLDGEGLIIGEESEYFLARNEQAVDREVRNEIIEDPRLEAWLEKELGAAMVEVVSPPARVNRLSAIDESIDRRKQVLKDVASGYGVDVIAAATHPHLSLNEEIPLSSADDGRYRDLIDHYAETGATGESENPDMLNPAAPAMSASLHSNFQAGSLEEAVDMTDYLLDVEAYTVALAGNCEAFGDLDTGWNDYRMIPWERSFNTEDDPDKVGLPDAYYNDRGLLSGMSLVFDPGTDEENAAKDRLDSAVGENWADARPKFYYGEDIEKYGLDNPTVVVEARLASMQDSTEMEAAVHGFRAGALAYRMKNNLPLLGISNTQQNREKAMMYGPEAEAYSVIQGDEVVDMKAYEALQLEIDRAREGLEYLGVKDDGSYLSLLEERL